MKKISKRIHDDIQTFFDTMILELKMVVRDKAVLFSFLGVAIFIGFLYTYVYSNEVLTDLPVGIVDHDNTTHSRQLLRMIDAASETKIQEYYTSLSEAKIAFENDEIRGIAVIPPDFSRKLQRKEQPTVDIYADAAYMLYYRQVLTAVKTSVVYMNAGIQIKQKSAQGKLPEQASDQVMAIRGKTVGLYNPSFGYATFIMPIVLMVIFQTAMLTAIGILGGTIVEEKQVYTLFPNADNLFGTFPIVMGKAAAHMFLAFLVLAIFLGILMPYFNIPMRTSVTNVVVFIIPFLLSIVYLGIFLNTFFKQRETAILFIMFTSVPAMMLSGFSYPQDMMPQWVQVVSYFLPSTMGIKGFIGLTQAGADFSLIKEQWIWLWGTCIFYLVLAMLSTKRMFLAAKAEIAQGDIA